MVINITNCSSGTLNVAIRDCLEQENESVQDSCMYTVFEKYNTENLLAAIWLSDCWQKAGGLEYTVPSFLVEEDFQFSPINLRTGQHVKHMSEYNGVFDG